MRSFEAKWPGTCSVCGDPYETGDGLWWLDDKAVHWDCSPANDPDREKGYQTARALASQERMVDRERVNCASCDTMIQPGEIWEMRSGHPYHERCD